jgi:hypothetical protein
MPATNATYKWNINILLFIYIHTDRSIGYTTQRPEVDRQCLWRTGSFVCKVSGHFISHTHSERACAIGDENTRASINILFVYIWLI